MTNSLAEESMRIIREMGLGSKLASGPRRGSKDYTSAELDKINREHRAKAKQRKLTKAKRKQGRK